MSFVLSYGNKGRNNKPPSGYVAEWKLCGTGERMRRNGSISAIFSRCGPWYERDMNMPFFTDHGKQSGKNPDQKPGFFAQVHAVVARIPEGKVMTYGQISDVLHNACSARYVGYAMRAAPQHANLPCHRVVNRLGEMAGGNTFGGAENQRRMLEAEGVPFTDRGRIDLDACLFNPRE